MPIALVFLFLLLTTLAEARANEECGIPQTSPAQVVCNISEYPQGIRYTQDNLTINVLDTVTPFIRHEGSDGQVRVTGSFLGPGRTGVAGIFLDGDGELVVRVVETWIRTAGLAHGVHMDAIGGVELSLGVGTRITVREENAYGVFIQTRGTERTRVDIAGAGTIIESLGRGGRGLFISAQGSGEIEVTVGSGVEVRVGRDGHEAIAVLGTGTRARLTNYGRLFGGLMTDGHTDIFVNHGTVTGGMSFGAGNDQVTNSNRGEMVIARDVDFGPGTDTFRNEGRVVIQASTAAIQVSNLEQITQTRGGVVRLEFDPRILQGPVLDLGDAQGQILGELHIAPAVVQGDLSLDVSRYVTGSALNVNGLVVRLALPSQRIVLSRFYADLLLSNWSALSVLDDGLRRCAGRCIALAGRLLERGDFEENIGSVQGHVRRQVAAFGGTQWHITGGVAYEFGTVEGRTRDGTQHKVLGGIGLDVQGQGAQIDLNLLGSFGSYDLDSVHPSVTTFMGEIAGAYVFGKNFWELVPRLQITVGHLLMNRFTDQGSVQHKLEEIWVSMTPTVEGRVRYNHTQRDLRIESWIGGGMEIFVLGPEPSFEIQTGAQLSKETVALEQFLGRVACGVQLQLSRWGGTLTYEGTFGEDTLQNAISAQLHYVF